MFRHFSPFYDCIFTKVTDIFWHILKRMYYPLRPDFLLLMLRFLSESQITAENVNIALFEEASFTPFMIYLIG